MNVPAEEIWEPSQPDDLLVMKGETGPLRLLLVDDEAAALDLLCALFEEQELDVRSTPSGKEALKLIEERIYHVVLTDLYMTPVNGTQILQAAKLRCPFTEVVLITGHASLDRAIEAIHHHAFDFVEKPFDIDKLERIVQNAFSKSRLAIENRRLILELQEQNQMLEERIRQATRELAELSVRDELTGLYNYRYLINTLEREISRSLRYKRSLSLAMIDLDFFKCYNDCHGHLAGNAALKKVAEAMLCGIRRADTVVRYGGEEFAIILPETEKLEAQTIVDRIRHSIRELGLDFTGPDGQPTSLTISAGISTCPEDTDNLDEIIGKADRALYEAKSLGRNQLSLAPPRTEGPAPQQNPEESR